MRTNKEGFPQEGTGRFAMQQKCGRTNRQSLPKKCEICKCELVGKDTICKDCYAMETKGELLQPSIDSFALTVDNLIIKY